MSEEISADQAIAFRVARHGLDRRAPAKDLLRVVKRVVGVQSQVSSAAVRSIAARVEGVSTERVDRALHDERTLARTWCLRCTLHVVARDDYALLAAALGLSVGGFKRWLERCGLTEARYAEIGDAVIDALAKGPLSRAELEHEVKERLHGTANLFGSWGGIMKLLALDGRVVVGPRRAQETTFVRTDRWWGAKVKLPPPDAALAELLRRYLAVFAPASVSDFGYWAGVPAGRARAALAALDDEVVPVRVGHRALHVLRADVRALRAAEPVSSVRLLPNFDTFLLGHRDKSLLFDEKHKKKVFRVAGWVSPVILEGGRVAGTWEWQGGRVALAPFARLSKATRAAVREEEARLLTSSRDASS